MRQIIISFILLCSIQIFPQSKNYDIQIKYKLTRTESFVVGDKPGHTLSAVEGNGTVLLDGSESGELKASFISDYTKGTGEFLAYYLITTEDKSILTLKAEGKTTNKGSLFSFDADVNVESGTGQFSSFKGTGKLKGERKAVIEKGSEVELFIKLVLD